MILSQSSLLTGCGYQSDRSLRRLFHNRQTATEFARLTSLRKDSPDIIFAPVPILELAQASVYYGVQKNIPVIVDIRDLWPDVYLTMIPKAIHSIGRKLLYTEFVGQDIFQKCNRYHCGL